MITFARFSAAAVILVIATVIVHLWLPGGRRSLSEVAPGIGATIVLWLVAGEVFAQYLAEFAFTYAIYYAGLASVIIALVFLYLAASIFVYGAELNTAIAHLREPQLETEIS
jgi:membrane protein